jgi:hypothetical protein
MVAVPPLPHLPLATTPEEETWIKQKLIKLNDKTKEAECFHSAS